MWGGYPEPPGVVERRCAGNPESTTKHTNRRETRKTLERRDPERR
jgi:hypothetical protein